MATLYRNREDETKQCEFQISALVDTTKGELWDRDCWPSLLQRQPGGGERLGTGSVAVGPTHDPDRAICQFHGIPDPDS